MSYKFDALISILNWMESGQTVTSQYIQEQLEISERTSFRYLQTLEGAGFPIYFDKKKGSYCFVEGYKLLRPNLTLSEALALMLAKVSLKGMSAGLEVEIQHIEEKLALPRQLLPEHIIFAGDEFSGDVQDIFITLNKSIIERRSVEFDYYAVSTRETSKRTVDPHYLYFNDGIWTMRGWCHTRKNMRAFGLDRISNLTISDTHYIPQLAAPHEEYEGTFGRFVDGEAVEVKLIFNKTSIPALLRKNWHPSQQTRKMEDGRLEMTLTVNGILGIRPWIYRWLPNVQVVAPDELVKLVASELKAALELQHYIVPTLQRGNGSGDVPASRDIAITNY